MRSIEKLRRESRTGFDLSRHMLYILLFISFLYSLLKQFLVFPLHSKILITINKITSPKDLSYIYISGKIYGSNPTKAWETQNLLPRRLRVHIPTDRLKWNTQYPLFVSFNPRHFPVSVFHDCQMRSPVFSRSCLSPPLPLPAYRDESARHESNDRRGFRFQRGGVEWSGGEGRKRRTRGKGDEGSAILGCFHSRALARFSADSYLAYQGRY